jgi:soluble lytic murein transglycosylase-like protein
MSIFSRVKQSEKKNVADLQRLINLMGYTRVKVDGYYGDETMRAVLAAPVSNSEVLKDFSKVRDIPFPRVPNKNSKPVIGTASIKDLITTVAIQEGVNPRLALTIATIESDLKPDVVSLTGASGLFQLTDSAISDVARFDSSLYRTKDRLDVKWNVLVGVKFIKLISEKYLSISPLTGDISDWSKIYAVYNIGYGNYRKLKKEKFADPKLLDALAVQAKFLSAKGPEYYLASVQSKIESVIA